MSYHRQRRDAHKKWARYHGILTGLSLMTVVGVLWAWLPAIRWYQHRKQAKKHQHKINVARQSEAPAAD